MNYNNLITWKIKFERAMQGAITMNSVEYTETKGCDVKIVLSQNRENSILVNGVEMKSVVRSVVVSGSPRELPKVTFELLPERVEITCMDATQYHKYSELT